MFGAHSLSDVNLNTTHIADPSIQAGAWAAVINVDITVCPCPPHSTVTLVPIHHILQQTYTLYTSHTDGLKSYIIQCMNNYTVNGAMFECENLAIT